MALKDIFSRKKKTEEKVDKVEAKAETKTAKKTSAKSATKKTVTKKSETKSLEAAPVVKTEKATEATPVKGKFSYRITEKATKLSDKNVFVLNIEKDMNKTELKKELEKNYKVTVLGINIVNTAKKPKFYRGKWGVRGGGKKAYVTLKAGDSIVL